MRESHFRIGSSRRSAMKIPYTTKGYVVAQKKRADEFALIFIEKRIDPGWVKSELFVKLNF